MTYTTHGEDGEVLSFTYIETHHVCHTFITKTPTVPCSTVCVLNRHRTGIVASFSVVKPHFSLPCSSCIYKTSYSGEHRPLRTILCSLFSMLRYCLFFMVIGFWINWISINGSFNTHCPIHCLNVKKPQTYCLQHEDLQGPDIDRPDEHITCIIC